MNVGDLIEVKSHGTWTGLKSRMRIIRADFGVFWLSGIHFIDGREIRQRNGFNSFVVADFKEIEK